MVVHDTSGDFRKETVDGTGLSVRTEKGRPASIAFARVLCGQNPAYLKAVGHKKETLTELEIRSAEQWVVLVPVDHCSG